MLSFLKEIFYGDLAVISWCAVLLPFIASIIIQIVQIIKTRKDSKDIKK
jgi:hypothetical protein